MKVSCFHFNLLFANFTLYIKTVGLNIPLISYIDALKPLGLKQFLFNSSYIPNSFDDKLLITVYGVIVLIYISVVARCSIPI
jgi:hypothetical protein